MHINLRQRLAAPENVNPPPEEALCVRVRSIRAACGNTRVKLSFVEGR